jgi:chaperone LolA
MKADFVMNTENPLLRRTTVSRGTLYQKNPDKLLLRFTDPVGDIIVSDGKFFWIYYPSTDAKQVIKSAAAAGGGAVDLRAQFIGDPLQRFQFTLDGHEAVAGRPADVLTLIPRQDLGYKKLKVWVDTQDGLVRQFEITEENTTRRLVLSDFQANPTLGDDLFRFTPPPGARIVERN